MTSEGFGGRVTLIGHFKGDSKPEKRVALLQDEKKDDANGPNYILIAGILAAAAAAAFMAMAKLR